MLVWVMSCLRVQVKLSSGANQQVKSLPYVVRKSLKSSLASHGAVLFYKMRGGAASEKKREGGAV